MRTQSDLKVNGNGKKVLGNVIKFFLLLHANMVHGWFWSKVYLAITMGLSILLEKLPVLTFPVVGGAM